MKKWAKHIVIWQTTIWLAGSLMMHMPQHRNVQNSQRSVFWFILKKNRNPFFFCSKHHVYLIHGIKSKYGGAIQYSLSVFQSILTIFFNRRRNQRIYLGCIRVKDLWFKPSLPKVLSEFLSFWELLQSFWAGSRFEVYCLIFFVLLLLFFQFLDYLKQIFEM